MNRNVFLKSFIKRKMIEKKWIKLIVLTVLLSVIIPTLTVSCNNPAGLNEPVKEYHKYNPPIFAPNVKGEIKRVTINGKSLTYEVKNGLAIYQGDMIIGDAKEFEQKLNENSVLQTQGIVCDGKDWIFFYSRCNKWPNAVVKYEIANDWGSKSDNDEMRSRIFYAMLEWRNKTNLRFVETNSGDRILFKKSDEGTCASKIGRINNAFDDTQDIVLGKDCFEKQIIHEIGHALGVFHEQSRQDREGFISVRFNNISDDMAYNFDKHNDDANDIGAYDYDSIMHYGCWAFSKDVDKGLKATQQNRTIVPTNPAVCTTLGKATGLSEGDVLAAYTLYPPKFSIKGIKNNERLSRIGDLRERTATLDFEIEAVDSKHIFWTGDWKAGVLANSSYYTIKPQDLSVGKHSLTAKIIINGVKVLERSINFEIGNALPNVKITEPNKPGQSFCRGEKIRFRAAVDDADNPPRFDVPAGNIKWKVKNSNSAFATGASVESAFGIGQYDILVSVTDVDGAKASDSTRINVVHCSSTPPKVNISNPPANGGNPDLIVGCYDYDEGFEITLRGSAYDIEDGTLKGSSLVWSTDRADYQPGNPNSGEQVLGTGESLTVELIFPHYYDKQTIKLTATDSSGTKSSSVRVIQYQCGQ